MSSSAGTKVPTQVEDANSGWAPDSWSTTLLPYHPPIRKNSHTLQPSPQIFPIKPSPLRPLRRSGFLSMSHPFSLFGPASSALKFSILVCLASLCVRHMTFCSVTLAGRASFQLPCQAGWAELRERDVQAVFQIIQPYHKTKRKQNSTYQQSLENSFISMIDMNLTLMTWNILPLTFSKYETFLTLDIYERAPLNTSKNPKYKFTNLNYKFYIPW